MSHNPFLLDANSILFPPGYAKTWRMIAVIPPIAYEGYFDESGKLNDSKVVAIAGYISTPKKWNRFSEEWIKTLRNFNVPNHKNYGVPVFHASDCENGKRDFEHLDKKTRTELVKKLAPIVNQHTIFGVGAAYFVDDYNEVTKGKSNLAHPMIKDPYYGCFLMVIYHFLIEQMKKRANSYEKVALVFDQNNEMQGRALKYFKSHQEDRETNLSEGRITGLTFQDDSEFPALQAADLLVFETYKECYNQRYDPTRPQRKCFTVLSSTNKILGGYLTREGLEAQVKLMKENNAF